MYLVVDDSKAVRHTLTSLLRKAGVPRDEILTASDGEEALEIFEAEEPKVVFLDITMPEIGGQEAGLTMLLEDPEVHVAIVTATHREDDEVHRLVEQGAMAYLRKPVTEDGLQEVLDRIEAREGDITRIQ